MELPPGDPVTMNRSPAGSKTSVGDMDERGRLLPATALATGLPPFVGSREKSVSWLFSTKPWTMTEFPKADSTVIVMETALP